MALKLLDNLLDNLDDDDDDDVDDNSSSSISSTLPSDFGNNPNAAQIQEILIMGKCVNNLINSKDFNFIAQQLNICDKSFNKYLQYFTNQYPQIINQQDQNEINKLMLSPDMQTAIYTILSDYNYFIRLKLDNNNNLNVLRQMEKSFNPSLLPPPTPSEIVLTELWMDDMDNKDNSNTANKWIGHGYYYKHGNGKKYTDLCVDYDGFEDKFMKLTKAKVIMADYNLLKNDFNSYLNNLNNNEIDQWLINNCAYFAEGQVNRMQMKYFNNQIDNIDVNYYLHFDNNLSLNDYIDFNQCKPGLRQRGGGRAATFLIDDKYTITQNGLFRADMLDVKGVGTHLLCGDLAQDKNGFLSGVDAMIEFSYQKLIQRILDIESNKHSWSTVQMYAIIDTGLRFKSNIENPATGYKGDPIALVVRQRHSRLSASNDEACFFSVAQKTQLINPQGTQLRNMLLKYGITSEQIPASCLLCDNNTINGDWNIQSDSAFSHMVDFSQFYCCPSSLNDKIKYKLPLKKWRMSMDAFITGCKLGRIINDFGDKLTDNMLIKIFGDNKHNLKIIQNKLKLEQQTLKLKWGNLVSMRKPKHAWSWFLETDDSELFKWAKDKAYNFNANFNINVNLFDQIPLPVV